MASHNGLLRAFSQNLHDNPQMVMGLVVDVVGSSYRRAGARILIFDAGRSAGSISGGCLERDLLKKAWFLTEGGSRTVLYDTRGDEIDPEGPFGTGCDGIVELFLERLSETSIDAEPSLAFIKNVETTRRSGVLATIYRAERNNEWLLGWKMSDQQHADIDKLPIEFRSFFIHEFENTLSRKRSRSIYFESKLGAISVLFEYIVPTQHLVVFGSGSDVVPLVHQAVNLGWRVTVIERRQRAWPTGVVSLTLEPNYQMIEHIQWDERTACVLMTHAFTSDVEILAKVQNKNTGYIGVLGSRSRTSRMKQKIDFAPNVYAPAGLDLGSDSPEIIAMSILAQIKAVENQRRGGMLSERHEGNYEAHDRQTKLIE